MKVSAALLPVALSGAIASVAVAPAHAAGHRAAPGRGARCVTVDRLTQTSAQAAATPRYWNPSRTRAAAGATQADLARALTSQRPAGSAAALPRLTRLCQPGLAAVPDHGTALPAAAGPVRSGDGYPTVGKFFYKVDDIPFNCTATVIGTNMIVTAAHCFKGDEYTHKYTTSNWMFAPMWHGNRFPYGKWYVQSVYIVQPWISELNPKFDFAVVILGSQHRHGVAYHTGQDAWNASWFPNPGQTTPIRIAGIPGNSKKALTDVTTAVAVEVGRRIEALRASTPGFGNGTSGGPWFRSFSVRNGTGTLDGVTGGYQDGGSNASPSYADIFSWYFSDLIAAASKRITHCNSTGDCRYWP